VDEVMLAARVIARLLIACTALVGLLLMHGIGMAAGTGCPPGAPAKATSMPATPAERPTPR
jgi:hypothetical protein